MVYTTYKVWLTPCSILGYTSVFVVYTTYKVRLWTTPHTRYGLRHVQYKAIQLCLWYTPLTRLGCGLHHIQGVAYAMFKINVYKMFVVNTTYKVRDSALIEF